METKVQPIINKYWADDAFPFELLPSFKELQIGGLGFEGYGCGGGSQKAVRPGRDGARPRRRFVLHVLRRPQRSRHGLDLSRRVGRAEAEMAAANGALGKDRSIDARGEGMTTGISARERARTIKAAVDANGKAEDFARPGHVFPLRARGGWSARAARSHRGGG